MKTPVRTLAPLLLVLLLLAALAPSAAEAARYVCPPCASPCDTMSFDKPGVCPTCGMTLVDAASLPADEPAQKKVGILVFNGVEIIDYTGPWEVFGADNFHVYTVAATRDPITTAMGMKVVPDYTFADAPQPDVLLVPGGGVRTAQSDSSTLAWVRKANAADERTMSVCNGAFILAGAGLLDGLAATTTAGNIERLRAAYPKVRVVDDQRFVDNGHVITTGGLTAGIDGALHVVAKTSGPGEAQQVALSLEYDWHPDKPFTPAAFAYRLFPNLKLDDAAKWTVLDTQGDRDHWAYVFRATTKLDLAQLTGRIAEQLTTKGKWIAGASAAETTPSSRSSRWTFRDPQGRPWTGLLTVETVPGASGQFTARLSIARAGKSS